MNQGASSAYWLAGDERCSHCLQRYSVSVERRCDACDGPACPHCVTVVHETREVICLGCEAEDATEPEEET